MALNKQPPRFKGSIGVDTRQTHYQPAKPIDYNNKMKEYNPPNKYYNAMFNDVEKKPRPQKQAQPKPEPKPQPKPQPKPVSQPKPQPKPEPKPQPKPQSRPEPKPQSQPKPSSPPTRVRSEPEPRQPDLGREEWAEPHQQRPIGDVAAAPVAIPIGSGLPSSVGSMSRMFSLFN